MLKRFIHGWWNGRRKELAYDQAINLLERGQAYTKLRRVDDEQKMIWPRVSSDVRLSIPG